jgi:hypothetical protein
MPRSAYPSQTTPTHAEISTGLSARPDDASGGAAARPAGELRPPAGPGAGNLPHGAARALRCVTEIAPGSGLGQASQPPPLIALWAGLILGIVLGGAITQWPYSRGCDLPLLGYLAAVVTVIAAGISSAIAAWRLRSAVAHVLALALFFWGMALAAERVLPRVGYAAERASWRCSEGPPASLAGSIVPARGSGRASPASP